MKLMDPQPIWEEDPQQDSTGDWCGRFHCLAGDPQNPEVDVDVDVHKAPADMPGAEPKEVERKWYWVMPNTVLRGDCPGKDA